MMRFEKRNQMEDETIDKFLDDLELLRRRSQPDESKGNDELRAMLATQYTTLSTNAPTEEELRLKSKNILLLKPPMRSTYYKNNYDNFNNASANQGTNWHKPRDDMKNRRSCSNCSSNCSANCRSSYIGISIIKKGMKAIGFSLEDEAPDIDHGDFMRGVTAKFGQNSVATWRVILNHIANNFRMMWRTLNILNMKRLCQALKPARHA